MTMMYENLSDAKRALLFNKLVNQVAAKEGMDNVNQDYLNRVFYALTGEGDAINGEKVAYYIYTPKVSVDTSLYSRLQYPEFYNKYTVLVDAGEDPLQILTAEQTIAMNEAKLGEENIEEGSEELSSAEIVLADDQQVIDTFLEDLYAPTKIDPRPWRWMPQNIEDHFNGTTSDPPQQFASPPLGSTPIAPDIIEVGISTGDLANYGGVDVGTNVLGWTTPERNNVSMGSHKVHHSKRRPKIKENHFRKGISV